MKFLKVQHSKQVENEYQIKIDQYLIAVLIPTRLIDIHMMSSTLDLFPSTQNNKNLFTYFSFISEQSIYLSFVYNYNPKCKFSHEQVLLNKVHFYYLQVNTQSIQHALNIISEKHLALRHPYIVKTILSQIDWIAKMQSSFHQLRKLIDSA